MLEWQDVGRLQDGSGKRSGRCEPGAAAGERPVRATRYESGMSDQRSAAHIVGEAVRSIRTGIGWTQRELGRRARMSQAMVCAVENGQVDDLAFSRAQRMLEAMGARLVITVDAPYLRDRERQLDPAHARCSAHVVGRLRRAGWGVATEVEVGGDRSRGWIDVLAFHPSIAWLLVIEIKTEIRDLGAIERGLGWYEREAIIAARRFGWQPERSLGCLLLLATDASEVRARANAEPLAQGFPIRARELAALVTDGKAPHPSGRAVAMIDPTSRRTVWLRPLRLDGRRSPAPFVDYADFMRQIGPGGLPRRRLDRAG